MATKKKVTKEVNAAEAEKKAAKRKARLEAIKNRPEGQRPNGKQIDVIETGNGVVKNYGYPLKNKDGHQGVLVTSVLETKDGQVVSTSVTFVPGKFTVKAKKDMELFAQQKPKKIKLLKKQKMMRIKKSIYFSFCSY